MNAMFQECDKLEYLDLSNFNTSNVSDMGWMFNLCHKLKKIKGINNLNTSNVTNMNAMLQECNELEYLILSQFNNQNNNINNSDALLSKLNIERKKNMELQQLLDNKGNIEKPMAVIFTTIDQKINYPVPCYNSDEISKLEEKLYLEFPELQHNDIYFISNGNPINRVMSLEQNKIKNGANILINYYE